VSMILMAAGLGLTSSPATEAIMGALPLGKAGVGSAVNDTTREVGGTLGVAIVGSVLSSAYGSHLGTALARLGVPAPAAAVGRQSVAAGLAVVSHLPAALRGPAIAAVRDAYMAGLHQGSVVAAVAAGVAALGALTFLPARPAHTASAGSAEPSTVARDNTSRYASPTPSQ
jgi:MFS transporter, DHA2 family, multidrug resistance protein